MANLLENKQDVDRHPLVSVIVITYNSSKYVLETLESIKAQTYKNLELIISDDCSTDNTVSICKGWLKKNKSFFKSAIIIESEVNKGVAENCDNAWRAANGKWLKYIAGDDILLDDGIERYMGCAAGNSGVNVIVSDLLLFGEVDKLHCFDRSFFSLPAAKQLKRVLLRNGTAATIGPSGFLSRAGLVAIGGFDTRYPMIEDYPLTLKYLENNIKIYHYDGVCVKYRINYGSISTANDFSRKYLDMYGICAIPIIRKHKYYLVLYNYWIRRLEFGVEGKGKLFYSIHFLAKCLDIYSVKEYIKSRFFA